NISVNSTNLDISEQLKLELNQRIKSTFSRINDRIAKVTISLKSINGPKAGDDKECKVKLTIPGLHAVVVTSRKDKVGKAISTALRTANQTVLRKLKKIQSKERKPQVGAYDSEIETD
ncbi:MAG: putative sigma-54 modulation protein, partial [Oleiphilaceae bacterium]